MNIGKPLHLESTLEGGSRMFWQKKIKVYAPIDGEFVALKDVEDEVFSSGMMGPGFAVAPVGDTIIAPVDAEIISASSNMRHALGLRLKNGCELLIHVGIDTVSLQNEGFNTLVDEGNHVKKGMALLKFDSQLIKKAGLKNTVMVIVTESKDSSLEIHSNLTKMKAGESIPLLIQ